MRRAFLAILFAAPLLAGGCHARISDGVQNASDPDAPGGGGGGSDSGTGGLDADVDGNSIVESDAGTPDATAATCTSRTVYLNFDGQALTKGPSDATTNHASWMNKTSGTAPPYLDGESNRLTAINNIVTGVRAQLASFPITVVTARPPAGTKYVMIVFGGDQNDVGSNFTQAVNELDCGDLRPNDVAWISDGVSPPQKAINDTIGAIGFGLGLTATVVNTDCMCSWANSCHLITNAACTLSPMIARDPDASQLCPGVTTQNEVATFHKAFCE